MVKHNILVGAISVLLGILILHFSTAMNMFDEYGIPGERFWPFCLAILFIFLGCCQWLNTFIHRHSTRSIHLFSAARNRAYLIFILMILYAIGLIYTGFILSSLILIPIIMMGMGEKVKWKLILSSVGIVSFIYIFFEIIFNSPLPIGLLFE